MADEGRTLGQYRLLSRLGGGGNADVWRSASSTGEVAVKVLRSHKPEPYGRFRREVDQLRQANDVQGVLPLLDAHLPEEPTRQDPAWLAMPIAEPLLGALGHEASTEVVVSAVLAFARTLNILHGRGVSHRDIKPANLYRYRDSWAIGDFGLVDAPGVDPLTDGAQNVGPRHYIAPEMILNPAGADGAPADVYSLAKTIWVLLTGQAFPLPGEHRLEIEAMGLTAYRTERRLRTLEPLLESMTQHDPGRRPLMSRVVTELDDWLAPASAKSEVKLDLAILARRANNAVAHERAAADRTKLRRETVDRLFSELSDRATTIADACVDSGMAVFRGHAYHSPYPFSTDATEHMIEELDIVATTQMGGEDPPVSRSAGMLLQAHEDAVGLKLWIAVSSMPRVDPETVMLVGAALVFPGGRRMSIWSEREQFIAGGPSEASAMDNLVTAMREHLSTDVERWIEELER
ncbi:protein kinase domain-containing protein [Actinoplanes subtropicus]|uniref:protein kinase domain-containing protein n=1 Tax=Actinoplanes subtropicus TaxID=543632 RepID=UPI0009FE8160|nr:protein kinase [Actinoplanes subtropicus]